MRPSTTCALIFWLAVWLNASPSLGTVTRQMHPWGRFQPGAWKLVRVVTETFGENGSTSSVSETKTTLSEVSENDVTLVVQVSLEVAGKQFDAEPQQVHQAFNGESSGSQAKVTDLGTSDVEIQGRRIPCNIQQIEVEGTAGKTVTQIYYSDTVAPYILKRQSKTTDPDGKAASETTVDVIALDVPCRTRDGIRVAAHIKAVQKQPKGTTTTLAVICTDVPGGILCHSLKELDQSGRMVRRSWLETIDYGLDPDDQDRGGFFHRRRARSTPRKPHRYYVPR